MHCRPLHLIQVEAKSHGVALDTVTAFSDDPEFLNRTIPLAGGMDWRGIIRRSVRDNQVYHWREYYVRSEYETMDKLWTLNDVHVQVPAMRPYFNANEGKLAFSQWKGEGKLPPCWDIVVRCEIDIIVNHASTQSYISEIEVPFWHDAWYYRDGLPFPGSIAADYQDIWDAVEIEVQEDDEIQDLIIDRRSEIEDAAQKGLAT